MLSRFLDSLFTQPADSGSPADREQQLQLAMAVLLVDVARSDWEDAPEERSVIIDALSAQFSLRPDQAQALVAEAETTLDVEASLHSFLATLNAQCSPEQKRQLIEHLWAVAFADGDLSKYEEHTIRRLADLLHVPHAEFIRAKHRQSRT